MIKERTDLAPGRLDGALCGLAQQVLELGEDLLNGVEIRAVRREEEEPCAGGSDHIANGLALVRAEVVEDHDIPRLQSCDQYPQTWRRWRRGTPQNGKPNCANDPKGYGYRTPPPSAPAPAAAEQRHAPANPTMTLFSCARTTRTTPTRPPQPFNSSSRRT